MIYRFFEKLAEDAGEKDAFACRGTDNTTFSELFADIKKNTSYNFIDKEEIAAVICSNTYGCVINLITAMICGRKIILMDASFPLERIIEILNFAGARSVFINTRERTLRAELSEAGYSILDYIRQEEDEVCERSAGARIMMFTSGTTSNSKMVVLEPEKVISGSINLTKIMPENLLGSVYVPLSCSHLYSMIMLFSYWYMKQMVYLGDSRRQKKELKTYNPENLVITPGILEHLLSENLIADNVTYISVAGSRCSAELGLQLAEKQIFIQNCYGSTECGCVCATNPYPKAVDHLVPLETIKITPLDEGIWINSPYAMEGYYKNPEETKKIVGEKGIFSPDQIAFMEDGTFSIIGRNHEFAVLKNGVKVSYGEMEARMKREIAEISEVCIGYSEEQIVAIILGADEEIIREKVETLNKKLQYHENIRRVIFTDLPLPRTSLGKLKRQLVYKQYIGE